MKLLKKTGHVLFYAIVLFLAYYVFLQVVMPEKTIDYIGFKSFVVLTPSMEPDIEVNDMIIVKKTKQENIEVGDAITFEVYVEEFGKEVPVTHYVAKIDRSGEEVIYHTQGAQTEEGEYDEWTDEDDQEIEIIYEDIAGVYAFKIPNLGFLTRMFQDPFMLAFITVDLVIIYFLVKTIRKKPHDKHSD